MYYALGPLLALIVSMKYTKYMTDKQASKCNDCCARIESIAVRLSDTEVEMPKKVMATLLPVAKAVQKLNREVGL